MIISVIGASHTTPKNAALAEEVGAELAKRGIAVACGGLGGIMEAVCKGCKSAGGTTIGILPGDDPQEANRWVDIPICTGMRYARNVIVVKTGVAVIAVDGGYGTLSEIGHALGEGIPVIGLNTWAIARNGQNDVQIIRAINPVNAVDKAIEAVQSLNQKSKK